MFDSVIKLVIGNVEDKRTYKKMMKRVDALPEDYRFAFRKIQNYIFSVGTFNSDIMIFEDLLDLFESSVADDRQILDVIGSDVGKFCDEFIQASSTNTETLRDKINKEIMERFNKEER